MCVSVCECASVSVIGTVNDSQKHGSRAEEASKTTGSGYRCASAAGCSLLIALYIRTYSTLLTHLSSNRPILKKLGLKTILLISFRST